MRYLFVKFTHFRHFCDFCEKRKGRRKQGNIVAEAKLRPGRKKCFWKMSKTFLVSRRRFCVFNICCVGAQTRNHLGNTEETPTSNVSHSCVPKQHILKTQNLRLGSKKVFCFFPVCSPMQHCEQH